MKIIICGAGQVGGQIARHLAREEGANHVTVIDRDPGADPPHHRRLRRQRHRRLRLAPRRPRAGRRPRRRHGDRRHPVGRGQHGGLPGGELDLLGAAQDRPPAGALLPQRHLLRPLPPGPPADRRGHLARVRGRRRGDAAAGGARGLRHRGLPRQQGAARRHRLDSACAVLNTPLRQLSELFSTLRAVVVGVRRGDRLFVPEAGRPALRRRPGLRDDRHRGPAAGHGDLRQDHDRRRAAC